MSNLVVILGAGASVSAGLPSLAGIFEDSSVDAYLNGDAREFLEFLEEFVWTPRGIDVANRWSGLHLEEVLTMLKLWFGTNDAPIDDAKNLRLQKFLLGCVFKAVYEDKKYNDVNDYHKLIGLAEECCDDTTWASYNWDAKLEHYFYWFRYGDRMQPKTFGDIKGWTPNIDNHTLLKLHGSVTWFELDDGTIEYARYGLTGTFREVTDRWNEYLASDATNPLPWRPLIAEPSFMKHEDVKSREYLRAQWEFYESKLSKADVVLIIGYSLPDGDAMAKQSLLTAVAKNPDAQYILVDPDSRDEVAKRYVRVFGMTRFRHYKSELGSFLDDEAIDFKTIYFGSC